MKDLNKIYISLRTILPNISLGTVYRNLSKLSDDGKILKLSCDGADHFDGNTNQHYHLFCNNCHRVFDTSKMNRLLSAAWFARKRNVLSVNELEHLNLCNDELEFIKQEVIIKGHTHDELLKLFKTRILI